MMLPPSSRNGAFGDQKGPSMEEEVGSLPFSLRSLWAISSTSLQMSMSAISILLEIGIERHTIQDQ
jgi:hypothetical protein